MWMLAVVVLKFIVVMVVSGTVWISAFNWLNLNGFNTYWEQDREGYVVLFLFSPLFTVIMLIQGIVFRTLDFFCKEN